jgi:hypothetical protein
MFLQELIEKLKKVSLTDKDIENILIDDSVKVIDYNEFDSIDNLDTIFENGKIQAIIFLLRGSEAVGHWVTLIADYKTHKLRCFEPYGLSLRKALIISTSDSKILLDLINQKIYEGWVYDENYEQLQAFNKNTTTCGMWCCLRTVFRHQSNYEFVKLIKKYAEKHDFKLDEACISLMTVSLLRVVS